MCIRDSFIVNRLLPDLSDKSPLMQVNSKKQNKTYAQSYSLAIIQVNNMTHKGLLIKMPINFNDYSLEDLKSLQIDLEKTIKDKAKEAKKTALQQIHNIANEHGLDLDDVLDGLKNPSKKKTKVAPKYQYPSSPS